jgi:subtilisin-like proprotein convertase family protein/N-acetylneuraminic acid mutarotase
MNKSTWALIGLIGLVAAFLPASGPLSFEERVEAQRALERVAYEHRVWPKDNPTPKPPFEALMPEEVLRHKVALYLQESALLESRWRSPLTGEQLQVEIARMAAETQDARALNELFLVLRNEPRLIAECLARPLLADRLLRERFAMDPLIHAPVRAQAEAFRRGVLLETFAAAGGDRYRPLRIVRDGAAPPGEEEALEMPDKDFARMAATFPPAGSISEVLETRDAFVIRHAAFLSDREIRGGAVIFPKRPFSDWLAEATAAGALPEMAEPLFRYALPVIAMDTARSTQPTTPNVWETIWYQPEPRTNHTAVWTGNEMIVWGGLGSDGAHLNSGGRYRPSTGTWTPVDNQDSPSGRTGHTAVWTGTEMIVWGGNVGGMTFLNTGGRYNPVTDSWTRTDEARAPTGRYRHTAVWTGTEMIVWGGQGTTDYLQTGSRYNPATDYWTHICTTEPGCGTPFGRNRHSAVWTGSEMIVWGGYGCLDATCSTIGYLNTGARYSPTRQDQAIIPVWVPTESNMSFGAPSPRAHHTAVWNGTQMMIWGGYGCSDPPTCSAYNLLDTGGSLDPTGNWWSTMSAPPMIFMPRQYHSTVWTGTDMIVWGGWNGTGLRDGAKWSPTNWTWTVIPSMDAPDFRWNHTAVWTGTEMVIWGGEDNMGRRFSSGGRFNPVTNSWAVSGTTPATMDSVPSARVGHTALWNGWELIVWGGNEAIGMGSSVSTGARYQPATQTWNMIDTMDGDRPSPRYDHTAVWTGQDMIVWGGRDTGSTNDGARYNPYIDWGGGDPGIWIALPATTLSGRYNHTAVWTGSRMVVWGGQESQTVYFGDGAQYDPGLNAWDPVAATDAPTPRAGHTAIFASWFNGTGTSHAMIVWGGHDATGVFGDGALFTPGAAAGEQGAWAAMSATGAPSARYGHSSVWADYWHEAMYMQYSEMIVWGGLWCNSITSGSCMGPLWLADGARYLPAGDAWAPLCGDPACNPPQARTEHGAVWTGRQMFLWGGTKRGSSMENVYLNDGRVYDLVSDTWDDVYDAGVPPGRSEHSADWIGSGVMVWGGRPLSQSGGIYYPNTTPIPQPYAASGLAAFDSGYAAPACLEPQSFCDTLNMAQSLVNSRDSISDNEMKPAHEPNAPNTLSGTCLDGEMGTYHADESVDRLRLSAVDGLLFHPNGDVRLDVTVWAGDQFYNDILTLYYAPNAASPAWSPLATLTPSGPGLHTFSHTFTLQAGGARHAVRAQFGPFAGTVPLTPCEGGDPSTHGHDRDDLVFAVTNEYADPSFVLGQTPALYLDGQLSGTGSNPESTPPFEDAFDSLADPQGYEWYIRPMNAAFAENDCLEAYYNDFAGPRLELTESDFSFLTPEPGPYMLWLRTTDELGKKACRNTWLQVKDGVAPTSVELWSPDGGETWPYSASGGARNQELIVWSAYDNFLLARYRLSYTTDEGAHWTVITDSQGNPLTNAGDVAIPDNTAGGATSTITVPGSFMVQGVVVTVNIIHPDTAELQLSLLAPDNTEVILSQNHGAFEAGLITADFTNTVFDDQAGLWIGSGLPPFTGVYYPDQPLDTMRYKNGGGNWRLKVVDSVSGNAGTIDSWSIRIASSYASSYWWSLPTQAEAAAAGQTLPSARCRVRVEVWDGAGNHSTSTSVDQSDANFYMIQPTTTSVKTLILWNSERIKAMYGLAAAADLASKLEELADHLKVTGVVLDLHQTPSIRAAYDAWDAAPQNQALANAVTTAIWNYLYDPGAGLIPKTYTNAAYLILVGDDFQVPFRRLVDGTMAGTYSESVYPSEVGINTKSTVGSAIAQGYVLTDNYLSEFEPEDSGLDSPHDKIYQNDLATGRLVEEPGQITDLIDTFLAYDGQLNANIAGAGDHVHVSGFTFVHDSAMSIKEAYRTAKGTGSVDCLLDDPDQSLDPATIDCDAASTDPDVEKPYTPSDLADAVFGPSARKLNTIMTHANHFSFAASKEENVLTNDSSLCTETTYSPFCGHGIPSIEDLTAAVVFTSGCHSGLPIPKDGCPSDTPAVIPDDGVGTVESTITVAGSGIDPVTSIRVRLNIRHTNDEDLVVTLRGPNAAEVLLISGVGGTGDHFLHTTLVDGAGVSIIDMGQTAPYTGFYVPVVPLAGLAGQSADGNWTLVVQDQTANGETGTLVCWSITFEDTDHYPSPYDYDLAESMARNKVLGYVANTGYGWAIAHGKGLTEMLLMMLNDEMLAGASTTVGGALANAKRNYFLEDKRYDVFDEKVLHELTLFGIPNYLVVTGSTRGASEEQKLPAPDGPDHGCARGVCLDKEMRTTANAELPSGLTELLHNFRFSDLGTYQLHEVCVDPDADGCEKPSVDPGDTYYGEYYTLNNYASGETGDAIQPKFIYESYLSGTTPHGVLFTGGALHDPEPGFMPLGAVPKATPNDPNPDAGPLPSIGGFTPTLRDSTSPSGSATFRDSEEKKYVNMVVHTGYCEDYDTGTKECVENRYKNMQFAVYYHINSTDTTTPTLSGANEATFAASGLPQAVPDNDPAGFLSTRTVSGSGITAITDINVILNITHARTSDLRLSLIAPNATEVLLSNGRGGSGDDFGGQTSPVRHTVFDMDATQVVTDGVAPFRGTYRPEGILSALDGLAADGTWTLKVVDGASGETGTLNSWSITFNERYHSLSGLNATFRVKATDASGLYRVLITYKDSGLLSPAWKSLDLAENTVAGYWEGTAALLGTTTYFVQAVDQAGNISQVTESGQDHGSGTEGVKYGSTWEYAKTFSIPIADFDVDKLPDVYEQQNSACLNWQASDAGIDQDKDYLTSLQEFYGNTRPCLGDTDGGGDNDGSERNNSRNPLSASDDKPLSIRALKGGGGTAVLEWPDGIHPPGACSLTSTVGENGAIDGYYFVYRSLDDPFFAAGDLLTAGGLAEETRCHPDADVPSPGHAYFYKVYNYALVPPQVGVVLPNTGPAGGGTPVSVLGLEFQPGARVYFGGIPAPTVTRVSASQLDCATPAHTAGVVTVKVVNPDGGEGSLPNGFTYTP